LNGSVDGSAIEISHPLAHDPAALLPTPQPCVFLASGRPSPGAPALHPDIELWLNLVGRWFKELTDRRLRRGVFTSVADLSAAITTWAEHWNTDPKPFIWKAAAEDIITEVQRGRDTLHQITTQTHH